MRAERFELRDSSSEHVRALAGRLRALPIRPAGVEEAVAGIIDDVRARGAAAVLELTRRFDSAQARDDLRVPASSIESALEGVDPGVREGLEVAVENVRAVARAETQTSVALDLPQGQTVSLRELPVRRAGIYVPGGTASYPSTVVMCSVPAAVAGVEERALATPPSPDGQADPVILAACALCGVEEVYLMGGAQAIAALALGTERVAAVDIVVGPGNAYVQEAKRQLIGEVAIDGIAGPSELVVVADSGADARNVSLDLAAQAEHGSQSIVILATPSAELIEDVAREAERIAERWPHVVNTPLALVLVTDLVSAIALANEIAPEHLELACADAERLAPTVTTSGCVFLGYGGATAFGDYAAGSNHVLPTGGAARFAGPLGASTFRRRQSLVSLPREAAASLAAYVAKLARAEGHPIHAESAEARAVNR